jgi:hypothetical protein
VLLAKEISDGNSTVSGGDVGDVDWSNARMFGLRIP